MPRGGSDRTDGTTAGCAQDADDDTSGVSTAELAGGGQEEEDEEAREQEEVRRAVGRGQGRGGGAGAEGERARLCDGAGWGVGAMG